MWIVKETMVPVVTGTLQQTPGTTYEISRKAAVPPEYLTNPNSKS